ncbi:unnamed protein product [Caenorhabditis auriculariae]|uniref:Uncharacterized protein n=1 Tax=Caenorhabditis auriculariae TaxID=2777116 RepID=A0A8S1HDK5_9PELO|nr:unnamed protein product [Caenorhabditis auriculariae]
MLYRRAAPLISPEPLPKMKKASCSTLTVSASLLIVLAATFKAGRLVSPDPPGRPQNPTKLRTCFQAVISGYESFGPTMASEVIYNCPESDSALFLNDNPRSSQNTFGFVNRAVISFSDQLRRLKPYVGPESGSALFPSELSSDSAQITLDRFGFAFRPETELSELEILLKECFWSQSGSAAFPGIGLAFRLFTEHRDLVMLLLFFEQFESGSAHVLFQNLSSDRLGFAFQPVTELSELEILLKVRFRSQSGSAAFPGIGLAFRLFNEHKDLAFHMPKKIPAFSNHMECLRTASLFPSLNTLPGLAFRTLICLKNIL